MSRTPFAHGLNDRGHPSLPTRRKVALVAPPYPSLIISVGQLVPHLGPGTQIKLVKLWLAGNLWTGPKQHRTESKHVTASISSSEPLLRHTTAEEHLARTPLTFPVILTLLPLSAVLNNVNDLPRNAITLPYSACPIVRPNLRWTLLPGTKIRWSLRLQVRHFKRTRHASILL